MSLPALLVVDDDPALLEALPETLRLQIPSARIDVACSAYEALASLKRTHYDVVLSDLRMPHMSGLEFMEEARTIACDTAILMMTGTGDYGLARRALDGGAFDFIMKPFDRHDLRESVKAALRCHALREKAARYRRRLVRLSEQYTKLHAVYHFRERPPLETFRSDDARRVLERSYGIMKTAIGHYETSVVLARQRIESLEATLNHATVRLKTLEREAQRRALRRFLARSIG